MNLRVPRGPVAATLPPTVAAHTVAGSLSLLLLVYWSAGLLDILSTKAGLVPKKSDKPKEFYTPLFLVMFFLFYLVLGGWKGSRWNKGWKGSRGIRTQ